MRVPAALSQDRMVGYIGSDVKVWKLTILSESFHFPSLLYYSSSPPSLLSYLTIPSHLFHPIPSSPLLSFPFHISQCVEIVTASICHYLSDPKSRSVFATKEVASIIIGVISSNPPVRVALCSTFTLLSLLRGCMALFCNA